MEFKGFGIGKQDLNVTQNRQKYVGGSDVPAIMGISPYKTQFELAKEKMGIVPREYQTNEYITFGNYLEPQIREYINVAYGMNFVVDTYIDENRHIRSNVDGIDKEKKILLEIKTHGKHPNLKVYEVQMQLYMHQIGAEVGWLALYRRPASFDIEFDAGNLEIMKIERDEALIQDILKGIEQFWERCERLVVRPDMSEMEFYSEGNDMDILVARANTLLDDIAAMKKQVIEMNKELRPIQQSLYDAMDKNNVKKIETPHRLITRVLPSENKRFDHKRFKEEHPAIYDEYLKTIKRKGYVKVTERSGN